MVDRSSGQDVNRADVAAVAKGAPVGAPTAAAAPGPNPDQSVTADPGVGVARARPRRVASGPTESVTLTQHWTNPETGESHLPGSVVEIDGELASQLRTGAWALPKHMEGQQQAEAVEPGNAPPAPGAR
jgi:hypothetical protein